MRRPRCLCVLTGIILPALAFTAVAALSNALELPEAWRSAARLCASVALYATVRRQMHFGNSSPSSIDRACAVLYGLSWGFVLGLLTGIAARLIPQMASDASSWQRTPAGILALCVLAPLSEELVYRGVIQPGAMEMMPPAAAILTAAALFSAAHPPLARMLPALAAGGLFGALAFRRGGLPAAVTAHAAANLVPLLSDAAALWLSGLGAAAILTAELRAYFINRKPYGGGRP